MRGVMLEVPSHLLEERARTGADRFDEMGEGELHLVPPPDEEHQRIEGAAALVIEIASPGDESVAKVPFSERVGVAEVVIVDRDTKAVRRWRRPGGGPALVEEPPAPDGRVALDAVAVTFRQVGDHLEVTTAAGVDHLRGGAAGR